MAGWRLGLAGVVALAASCAYQIDQRPTDFLLCSDGRCPAGYACAVDNTCRPESKDVVTALTSNGDDVCAVVSDGSVACASFVPLRPEVGPAVRVPGLSRVTSIALGFSFGCALRADGSVACWAHQSLRPPTQPAQDVEGLGQGVLAVGVGSFHACALRADGSVACWGGNAVGQLGDGTRENRASPVSVQNVAGAIALTVGSAHACVLLTSGAVRCWGFDDAGQVGSGRLGEAVVQAGWGSRKRRWHAFFSSLLAAAVTGSLTA